MAVNTRSYPVTTTHVSTVSFGFYTSEEVRRRVAFELCKFAARRVPAPFCLLPSGCNSNSCYALPCEAKACLY